jgi:AcrR family transcriptional regulator
MTELANPPSRADRRREQILDAAEALLAHGAAFSVRRIGARVGITGAGLYNHFESLGAIVEAVCERRLRRLLGGLEDVTASAPLAQTSARTAAFLGFASERPRLYACLFDLSSASGRRRLLSAADVCRSGAPEARSEESPPSPALVFAAALQGLAQFLAGRPLADASAQTLDRMAQALAVLAHGRESAADA